MSDYPNSGILSRNKYKKAGSKMPDAKGQCTVTCKHCQKETEFEIAGWIKEGRTRFTALKFSEKGEAGARRAKAKAEKSGLPVEGQAPAPAAAPAEEDNIPF